MGGNSRRRYTGRWHGQPDWVFDGHIAVQAIENLPHGLRLGLTTAQTPDHVRDQRDPRTAERLQRQGITFVILDGVRGLGPETDMREVRANRPVSEALKQAGIRRVLYVQTIGQLVYESFVAEEPRAAGWVQKGPDGETPTFGAKWWQRIPCLNNDEFLGYVKQMVRSVMCELDLDGIFTDLYGYYTYSCVCEHCTQGFRDYLNRKYTDADAWRARFGFVAPFDPPPFRTIGHADYVTGIPEPHTILDPVSQEWIRFRCERLGEVTRELRDVVRDCNPDGILYVNYLYGGIPGLNCGAFHGVWPEQVLAECDLFSAEVAGKPELLPTGVVKTRVPQMKVAKAFGIPVTPAVTRTDLKDFRRLYLAEGMAFNTSPFDWVGQIHRDNPPDWMYEYRAFWREYRDLLGRGDTIADCGVLHAFEPLSFACSYPQESTVLCEQSLLQANITYDIIFERDLTELARDQCLFLPNVIALSQEHIEAIAEHVRRGGAVVATEDTGALDEFMQPWRGERYRREKSHLLGELLGIEWPESGSLCEEVGEGRIAVVADVERPWGSAGVGRANDQRTAANPRVTVAHSFGPEMPMVAFTPQLSGSHDELIAAVDFSLRGRRTVRLDTGGSVISEVTQNRSGRFIHLLNWDEVRPVSMIRVSARVGEAGSPRSVARISPDRETPDVDLDFQVVGGRVEFEVPDLHCYSVVVLAGP